MKTSELPSRSIRHFAAGAGTAPYAAIFTLIDLQLTNLELKRTTYNWHPRGELTRPLTVSHQRVNVASVRYTIHIHRRGTNHPVDVNQTAVRSLSGQLFRR